MTITATPKDPTAPDAPALTGWRAYLKRWTKPPRRLTFTRAGKFFILITLGVGAGALNTGNNLLFLLLGLMLSAITASGVLSEAVLRKLKVTRRAPRRVFAQLPAPGELRFENPRRYPSLNVEVCEMHPLATAGPMAGQTLGMRDLPWWKFWVSDVFDDTRYVAIARAWLIESQATLAINAPYHFSTRGHYTMTGLRLATRFPFGLFHKVAETQAPMTLIVLPSPAPADDWAADVASRLGETPRSRAGVGHEYFGLRTWRPGEDMRQIHWKASARRDALVIREWEEERQRAVMFVLSPATGSDKPVLPSQRATFEAGLSKLTGLILAMIARQQRVGIATPSQLIAAGDGEAHGDLLLRQLAALMPEPGVATGALPRRSAGVAVVGVGFDAAWRARAGALDMILPFDESTPGGLP